MNVSVVIPTYNRARLIGRAIESALTEIRPGDEVIVVNDGSTDDTTQAVASYLDRIRYLEIPHGGAGRARNRGVREARGDLVAFLDSDDAWLPGKLALQRALMEARPDVLFSFTDFITDHFGTRHPKALRSWHDDPRPWSRILGPPIRFEGADVYLGDLYAAELENNYVYTATLLVRRRDAGAALEFAEGVPTYEDWWCYARLARQGTAAFVDRETAVQYSHQGPRLTDAGTLTCAETRLLLMREIWGRDQAFLTAHAAEYHRALRRQRVLRLKGLLAAGRAREARQELVTLGPVPLAYRILATFPGVFTAGLLRVRRSLV